MKWSASIKFIELLGALAQAATVLSLFVILAQLRTEAEERRVERSLAFVQRFNDEYLATSRVALLRPWRGYEDELRTIHERGMPEAREQELVRKIFSAYANTEPEKDPMESVQEIAEFFDTLNTCVSAGTCDADVAQKALGAYAKSFNCTYGFLVDDRAGVLGSAGLGSGLKEFAGTRRC